MTKPRNGATGTVWSHSLDPLADPRYGPLLRWDFTPMEHSLAQQCAERLRDMARAAGQTQEVDLLGCTMELLAVHCNDVRLNLLTLRYSLADDFMHDIVGIATHLDRRTGKLMHGWRPRNVIGG